MALVADLQCLPDDLRHRTYEKPTNEGVEHRIRDARGRDQAPGESIRPLQKSHAQAQPTVERLFSHPGTRTRI